MIGVMNAAEAKPSTSCMDAVVNALKNDRWSQHDPVSFKIHDGKDAPRRELPFLSRRYARCVVGPTWTTMYVKDDRRGGIDNLDSVRTDDLPAVRRMARELLNYAG